MVKTVSFVTEIMVSAEIYHALRQDRGFDRFCAEDDAASYILHAETEEVDPDGEVIVIVDSTLNYGRKGLPPAVSGALGLKQKDITVNTNMRFYETLFGQEHLCEVETRPSALGGRTRIFGHSWLEPISTSRCNLHSDLSIEIRLAGVGGMLERMVASRVKAGLKRLNKLMYRYMETDECKSFLAVVFPDYEATNETPERAHLRAPPQSGVTSAAISRSSSFDRFLSDYGDKARQLDDEVADVIATPIGSPVESTMRRLDLEEEAPSTPPHSNESSSRQRDGPKPNLLKVLGGLGKVFKLGGDAGERTAPTTTPDVKVRAPTAASASWT